MKSLFVESLDYLVVSALDGKICELSGSVRTVVLPEGSCTDYLVKVVNTIDVMSMLLTTVFLLIKATL